MRTPALVLDEIEPHAQCDGAQTVQQGIELREEEPLSRQGGRWVVEIQEPQQKCDGSRTGGKNSAERHAVTGRRSWTNVNDGPWQVGRGSAGGHRAIMDRPGAGLHGARALPNRSEWPHNVDASQSQRSAMSGLSRAARQAGTQPAS